eukprot:scaffold8130_cov69-Phaeocystis_antarctica.AAC.8
MGGAKRRCGVQLRPQRERRIVQEVVAVGCRVLLAEHGRIEFVPRPCAMLHMLEPPRGPAPSGT